MHTFPLARRLCSYYYGSQSLPKKVGRGIAGFWAINDRSQVAACRHWFRRCRSSHLDQGSIRSWYSSVSTNRKTHRLCSKHGKGWTFVERKQVKPDRPPIHLSNNSEKTCPLTPDAYCEFNLIVGCQRSVGDQCPFVEIFSSIISVLVCGKQAKAQGGAGPPSSRNGERERSYPGSAGRGKAVAGACVRVCVCRRIFSFVRCQLSVDYRALDVWLPHVRT